MKELSEMDRNTYFKLVNAIIFLAEVSKEYNAKELSYMGIRITITSDKNAELIP